MLNFQQKYKIIGGDLILERHSCDVLTSLFASNFTQEFLERITRIEPPSTAGSMAKFLNPRVVRSQLRSADQTWFLSMHHCIFNASMRRCIMAFCFCYFGFFLGRVLDLFESPCRCCCGCRRCGQQIATLSPKNPNLEHGWPRGRVASSAVNAPCAVAWRIACLTTLTLIPKTPKKKKKKH